MRLRLPLVIRHRRRRCPPRLLLVTWDYCLPAWVLYKSIRAVTPTIEVAVLIDDGEDFARLYTEPSCAKLLAGESNDDGSAMAKAAEEEAGQEEAAAAVAADPDKAYGVRVHRIASEKLPAVASITNARFRRAINKLGALGLSMYSRVLLMDADTVLLQSPDEWFRLIDESGEAFATAVDQYDGCTRREVINLSVCHSACLYLLLMRVRACVCVCVCVCMKWHLCVPSLPSPAHVCAYGVSGHSALHHFQLEVQ